jgi:hypothetical protein
MKQHLLIKDQLINAKRGDTFVTEYYLEGWRNCEITIGSRWATIKPLFGKNSVTKMLVSKMKRELADMYWHSAAIDAHYKGPQNKRYQLET